MLIVKNILTLFLILFSLLFNESLLADEVLTQQEQLRKTLSVLGDTVVGKRLPDLVIDAPYKYISGNPGKYIYKVIDDENDTSTKFEIHGEYNEQLDSLREWDLIIDNDFIEEWGVDSKANVHLMAQTDVESGYRVVLKPHLMLPAGAQSGQRWQVKSKLTVYETSSPDAVAYQGTLLSNKAYEGRFEVMTPAGKFAAILISDNYEINIGAVNIKDRRYTFYALDVGKIAEIDGFHVSAFLFFHQRRNDVKVLMTVPQETDE